MVSIRKPNDDFRTSSIEKIQKNWLLVVIVCLLIISRVPFIPLGYGADDDAWRIARSVKLLCNACTYSVSRLPEISSL